MLPFSVLPKSIAQLVPVRCSQLLTTGLLLGFGYLLGSINILDPAATAAQLGNLLNSEDATTTIDISNDAVKQIQSINESVITALETLRIEGHYNPATEGINPYLLLTGGGDAIDDLERGTGVDPLTFAQLYAGQAVREVSDELTTDEQGRLLYKNSLVRIYSPERLKKRQETARAILEKRVLP